MQSKHLSITFGLQDNEKKMPHTNSSGNQKNS